MYEFLPPQCVGDYDCSRDDSFYHGIRVKSFRDFEEISTSELIYVIVLGFLLVELFVLEQKIFARLIC